MEIVLADAYAVGKILHPDRFRDVGLPRRADEIFRFMVGAPVYTEMENAYGPLGGRPAFLDSADWKP